VNIKNLYWRIIMAKKKEEQEEKLGGGWWLFWFIFLIIITIGGFVLFGIIKGRTQFVLALFSLGLGGLFVFFWRAGFKGWLVFSVIVAVLWITTTIASNVWWLTGFYLTGWLNAYLFIVLVVPLYLAPRALCWSFIEEARSVIFLKGAKYDFHATNYEGFYQDKEGYIRRITPSYPAPSQKITISQRLWGGIRWFGIVPIHERAVYHQKWNSFRENEPGKVKKYDEELDSVFLPLDYYVFQYERQQNEAIEDLNGVPVVGVVLVIPVRVFHPRLAIFSTTRWLEAMSAVVWPILENLISNFRYDADLSNMIVGKGIKTAIRKSKKSTPAVLGGITVKEKADLREIFWNLFKEAVENNNTFIDKAEMPEESEECFSVFGVMPYKDGIRIYKIDPAEEYRQARALEYLEEQKGVAAVKKAEKQKEVILITAKAQADAAKINGQGVSDNLEAITIDFVMKALRKKHKKLSDEEFEEAFERGDLEKEYEYLLKMARQLQSIKEGQFFEVEHPEGSIEGALLSILKKEKKVP